MTEFSEYLYKVIDFIPNIKPYAALAYGSRVAGYATDTSDYDYIVIVENYKEAIRYLYRKIDGVYASLLIVDKKFFEEDIYEGLHGEFVSGRLYTVYKPLINGEYIKKLEVSLKERAILEEICLLKSKYDDLIPYMKIPLRYILLARLRKRMLAYPPVKYSYYKMFYGPNGAKNISLVLNGFRAAAEYLERQGIISILPGNYIKIEDRDKIPCSPIDILKIISRGFKMYYTHGRSAKVDLKVVFNEVASKIKRGFEHIKLPNELRDPSILLELDKGKLISVYKSIEDLIKNVIGGDIEIKRIVRKGLLSELYYIDIDHKGVKRRVVLKKFSYIYLFKWILIILWLIGIKRFSLTPKRRLVNEYTGILKLREAGINTPEIYAVVWRPKAILMSYVDGKPLNKVLEDTKYVASRQFGEILKFIHSMGYTLGDTKPNNIIYSKGDLYILDLEQFNVDNATYWDIGEYLYYSGAFWNRAVDVTKICSSFFKGYLKKDEYTNGRELETLKHVINLRFILAFLPLTPISRIYKIYRCVKNLLN